MFLNLLKPNTHCMHHQLEHSEIPCSVHSALMCIAFISEQRLFLYTAII